MANIISFDTGIKEFNINDAVTVRFSPTDMCFIERVFEALERLDKRAEEYRGKIEKVQDREVFDLAKAFDAEVKDEINAIFGDDVCTPLFGDMSMNTLADGFPIWANFLMAVIDTFDGAFAEEKKKTNPRIKKYTAKYQRK